MARRPAPILQIAACCVLLAAACCLLLLAAAACCLHLLLAVCPLLLLAARYLLPAAHCLLLLLPAAHCFAAAVACFRLVCVWSSMLSCGYKKKKNADGTITARTVSPQSPRCAFADAALPQAERLCQCHPVRPPTAPSQHKCKMQYKSQSQTSEPPNACPPIAAEQGLGLIKRNTRHTAATASASLRACAHAHGSRTQCSRRHRPRSATPSRF